MAISLNDLLTFHLVLVGYGGLALTVASIIVTMRRKK